MWMPGCLAKEGSELRFGGPEPVLGKSKRFILNTLPDHNKSRAWNNSYGTRHGKKLQTGLKGYCPLKYHLNKMGLVVGDKCCF